MASPDEHFPPVEEALLLPAEDLALCLLNFLRASEERSLNVGNSTGAKYWQPYAREKLEEFEIALSEAWSWLIREGIVVPKPTTQGGFLVFSRRAHVLQTKADLESYRMAKFLPQGKFDPVLEARVRPTFLRGEYETAVLLAFREVEIRVRDKAKQPATAIGVSLMRTAFDAKAGALADKTVVDAEREATAHLFAGAIGLFKNPSSHRAVAIGADEAIDLIHFANHLLRIVMMRP